MRQWQWKYKKFKFRFSKKVHQYYGIILKFSALTIITTIAIFSLTLLAPTSTNSSIEYASYVIDGDTFNIGSERIRILGIDTPELKARCSSELRKAKAAKLYAQHLLKGGFSLKRHGKDSYGRTLAYVTLTDGNSYTEVMLKAGHGRRYNGGVRSGWCD